MGRSGNGRALAFRQDADKLAVYQTDLVAQIEYLLRAARRTILVIEKLQDRNGFRLTTSERHEMLDSLAEASTELDSELTTQHESCVDIQNTITKMRARLLRRRKRPSSSDRARHASQQDK